MPAASPRRQASPVDMTLTSARTTRWRPTLADLGGSCWDEDVKRAAGAKETAVRYIEAAAGTETEALSTPAAEPLQPARDYDPLGRVGAGRRKARTGGGTSGVGSGAVARRRGKRGGRGEGFSDRRFYLLPMQYLQMSLTQVPFWFLGFFKI